MVGPTEALSGPATIPAPATVPTEVLPRRPGSPRPGSPRADAPPGAASGQPDRGRQTGWQLAVRVWENSGVAWEAPPAQATPVQAAPPEPYNGPASYAAEWYGTDWSLTDPRPTRPDFPVPSDRAERVLPDPVAAVRAKPVPPSPVESSGAMGPWPIQKPRNAEPEERAQEPSPEDGDPTAQQLPVRQPAGRAPRAPGSVDREPGSAAPPLPRRSARAGEGPSAPPLPRRIRRASEGWNAAPSQSGPDGRNGQAPPRPSAAPSPFAPSGFAPASPFAPSDAFASSRSTGPSWAYGEPSALDEPSPYGEGQPYGPAAMLDDTVPDHTVSDDTVPDDTLPDGPEEDAPSLLSAPVADAPAALGEPDELFRAWQGSVDQAAGRRAPRAARRSAARREAGFHGRGWQAAKIGVPAVVIVTVGAGALLMLTGRANDMLAERATNEALSSGKPTSGPVASGQTSVGPSSAARSGGSASGLTLAGYPAEHGTVGVAALWSAGGTTVAVGYADGHPAVWRHAGDGTWSLVSTAVLGGVTGHLTSVVQGPSGWIAVGSVNESGTVEPTVFSSADGVTWQQVTTLTAVAGRAAQFLGVAAGPAGYLVVGKQGTGNAASVALWWSGNLQNWVSGENNGPAGSYAAAAVATTGGFVAVGSENNCHTFWTSADGQHWTAHDLAKPSGATTATLTSVAAGQGGRADRFVAAGVATTSTGDLPIVVTAANDGTHITQTVLSPAGDPATVTAVTATADGFVAVGAAGAANAQHAVTWTSLEGRIWTPATALAAAGTSEVTALAPTSTPGASTTLTATAQRGAAPALLTIPAP